MHRWLRRDERGFTLIEMMVVLAIIALIAIFAIPNIVEALQNGRINTVGAQARQIQAAFDEYYNEFVTYPEPYSNGADEVQKYQYFFGSPDGKLSEYVSLPDTVDKALFVVLYYNRNVSSSVDPKYCMIIQTKNVSVSRKNFEIRKNAVTQTDASSCTP